MRLGFFIFLITVPFLTALGFDYFDYMIDKQEGFNFNQLGAIWAQNFRESYLNAKNSISPESWEIVTVFLKQPAALLGFLFAQIMYVLIALTKIISWFLSWNKEVRREANQQFETQDIKDLDFLKKNQKDNYKYKYKYKK